MTEIIKSIFPNVYANPDRYFISIKETLIMTGWAGCFMFVFGLILGITLIVTKKGGILQNKVIFHIVDKSINFFRSIPFVILIALLLNVTKFFMGTKIGLNGAIVPLIFGSVPFFARQVESALSEVDDGLVEAARSMGCSPLSIIFRVYLKESIAGLSRATTITLISLIGLTAMAGYVGAGGLGDYSITYGYNYNRMDIVWAAVIAIVLIVSIIQLVGTFIAKKNTH
jgi:D-methionine transport system permease protein